MARRTTLRDPAYWRWPGIVMLILAGTLVVALLF